MPASIIGRGTAIKLVDCSSEVGHRKEPEVGAMNLNINGEHRTLPADMPLLWVLRDVLGMTGTKFGCGIA